MFQTTNQIIWIPPYPTLGNGRSTSTCVTKNTLSLKGSNEHMFKAVQKNIPACVFLLKQLGGKNVLAFFDEKHAYFNGVKYHRGLT